MHKSHSHYILAFPLTTTIIRFRIGIDSIDSTPIAKQNIHSFTQRISYSVSAVENVEIRLIIVVVFGDRQIDSPNLL